MIDIGFISFDLQLFQEEKKKSLMIFSDFHRNTDKK